MQNSSLDTQLDLLESQLNALSASLVEGRPDALQSGSAALQRLAVDLLQVTGGKGLAQFKQPRQRRRVQVLATGIANLRENLLRHMAYVDRALEIVVPATRDKATYAGSGAYGQPVRQSGAFSVLAA
ncbi:hypothetical protein HZ993_11020 [Rhodoferax sp. AJA081-3]|uniref:hypothetical protein n=1 Tax=Rhodoferax sp. AJA081-3 TaxID=2752316 RepID=UPI001ADFC86B|nr:hypothetical protein [Rhodoferax sp. AJA081-3]QTN30278.1 hypothetical protein HZ993_11020 [Rhodoferax sp. AJA081-3]